MKKEKKTKKPFVNKKTNKPFVNKKTNKPFVNKKTKKPFVNKKTIRGLRTSAEKCPNEVALLTQINE